MYPGASITQEDGLQILMKLRNDCKISDKAFGRVLQAVDQLLPDNHSLPPSNYLFRQRVGSSNIYITEQEFFRAHKICIGSKCLANVCPDSVNLETECTLERFFMLDVVQAWKMRDVNS